MGVIFDVLFFIAVIYTSISFLGGRTCSNYGEEVGMQTKHSISEGCQLRVGKNWMTKEQYMYFKAQSLNQQSAVPQG